MLRPGKMRVLAARAARLQPTGASTANTGGRKGGRRRATDGVTVEPQPPFMQQAQTLTQPPGIALTTNQSRLFARPTRRTVTIGRLQ